MKAIEQYSQKDLEDVQKFLRDPAYPDALKAWIKDFTSTHIMALPVEQLIGHPLFIYRFASIVPNADTIATPTGWRDMATVGPRLDNLAKGRWMVFWGCTMTAAAATVAMMGVSINGISPSDSNSAKQISNTPVTEKGGTMYVRHFNGGANNGGPALTQEGTNSIVAKYQWASGGTMTISNRWLAAIRTGDV